MSTQHNHSRRDFLKTTALAGLGIGLAGMAPSRAAGAEPGFGAVRSRAKNISQTRRRPAGQKPVHSLTTSPIEKVRVGLIGCGGRGGSLLKDLLNIPFVEVTAICDVREERVAMMLKRAGDKGQTPRTYSGGDRAWENLLRQDNIDVVYVATPWEWHCEMSVKAMEAGKHAFVEVSAAVTVDECWKLVDTSEKTQRHCAILENCCYGRNELFVLNMAREGVFGELTHAECAYIHDLRGMLFKLGTEGDWRREYHKTLDGNLYPTHGLGPVCQYMGIGRGDQMKYLVSMSSPEAGLSKWLREKNPNDGRHAGEKYVCGDMNTTLVKTELGRSIMIQHDVISPRPYSRINALSGTGGTFFGYPNRLALDDPKKYNLKAKSSHGWLKDDDFKAMRERFDHPLYKQLQERAKNSGHGGMDYVMSYRLLDCIRKGLTPDMTVYDAALWSCILELSAKSVQEGSHPVGIPDFTRGDWKAIKPLGIATT
ncbi:hypothetical protein M2103_001041 [Ereboglobus sp. PH5-5]|uniref:Gfo/Idh/MocA family oxidoreductase n=1 Tax=Ereboglobus sp. PH5-5 TaxID=2940529 RepID=UPI0024062825|nr:Gfo/Idh/MocA family oxidoreductase [Ereboglobus sp. PH5-5]MDF9832827.1 hypothetical protein [Ereboglobus sp. PH5-5]